ncbi:hypothetical protein BOTBODRAFT_33802 [Botryobasidium botryosum FD-172 SS1]|uniref:GLTSCR protein conserved domain-containing protein n=1 Tax=Botryobasidium botryosum (strain FD-172 SS1) TaxID=930990 RepID=A0A067MC90_BOTB1|nr:hypothetical protein BOTBODRAFT_33802 [Botryobasidium botryosum FD-172 SS1]
MSAQPASSILASSRPISSQNGAPSSAGSKLSGAADMQNKDPATKRRRTEEEDALRDATASRVKAALAADHYSVLYPDTQTPFRDAADVVNRLLPYHVFQHPAEELDFSASGGSSCKGKEREPGIVREVEETTFALECFQRRQALQDRFREIRTREAQRSSPIEQIYFLTTNILETERVANSQLSAELRNLRAEHEKIERQKRLTAAAAARPAPPPPITTNPYSNPALLSSSHPGAPRQPASTSVFRPYHHPYAYSYSSTPSTPYASTPATPYASTPTTPYASIAPTPTSSSFPLSPNVPSASSTAPVAPIPIQIPASALSALHAIGITPVHAPPPNAPPLNPPPTAMLLGSTADGRMLNLTINLAALAMNQMNGLATILNGVVSNPDAPQPIAPVAPSGAAGGK